MTSTTPPWNNPSGASDKTLDDATFHPDFPTEFRQSSIPGAGRGWFAKCPLIPKGTRLRTVSVEAGTLLRFGSTQELLDTKWFRRASNADEVRKELPPLGQVVHYAIGLADGGAEKKNVADETLVPSAGNSKKSKYVYLLNPGTACNHAFPVDTNPASIRYHFDEATGCCELWTIRDVKEGEEMFIDYAANFSNCDWYDRAMFQLGQVPVSWLAQDIEGKLDKEEALKELVSSSTEVE